MECTNRFLRGESDLREFWKDAKEGDGRKVHRIHDDRSDEGLEVWLGPEEVAEVEGPISARQTDTHDHQTERARVELAT